MLSIVMNYMPENDEVAVVRQSTGAGRIELKTVMHGQDLLKFQTAVREVALPAALGKYIVDLVASSRPTEKNCPDFIRDYVAWGAGLRASQNIALAAKSFAAQDGRGTARLADVRRAIVPVMRHRIGLAFRAAVDRVSVEDVIQRLVKATPEPKV